MNFISPSNFNDNIRSYYIQKDFIIEGQMISDEEDDESSFEEEEDEILFEEEEEEIHKKTEFDVEKENELEYDFEYENDYNEYEEENDVKVQDQNNLFENKELKKIRDEAIKLRRGFRGNRYSVEMKKYASILYYSSDISYTLIRKLFCFPCNRRIRDFCKPFLNDIKECLFDENKLEQLLSIQKINYQAPIECNIGVDAAVFLPISGEKLLEKFKYLRNKIDPKKIYSSIFCYVVEPLDANLKSFPIHIHLMEDGFANDTIKHIRDSLIQKLKIHNIICRFTSTDGDRFFNGEHEDAFLLYKEILESGGSIDEILEIVKKTISEKLWPISDILHILKNTRVTMLFRNIGLSLLNNFNPDELNEFISIKSCLNDKTSQGSMKDSYPLTIFGFESFMSSINYDESNFLITPFFLIIEALRNIHLKIEIRKSYLRTAFLFTNYFLHISNFVKTVGTRMMLIRLMNTILGLLVCLERPTFNIAHLGTHPIECFFGLIRIGCHFQHTIFNILRTISRSILTINFMSDLNIKKKINGRINIAGATIMKRDDEYGFFPFCPDDFFILMLRKLHGFNSTEEQNNTLNSWYEYLIQKHSKSDDCEVYLQNPIVGCNISSRNVNYSPKKPNHVKSANNRLKSNKLNTFYKNYYLKKYPGKMNQLICLHLNNLIKKFPGNSMLIISKMYGFVFQKGAEKTQICYSEDLSIIKVFNDFNEKEKKRIKNIKKLASSGGKKTPNIKQKKKTVIQESTKTEFISQPNNFAPSNQYSAMNQTRFISQPNIFAPSNQYSAMNQAGVFSQSNNFAPSNQYSAMNQTRFISQPNNFAPSNQYSAMNQAGVISQSNYYSHVNLYPSMNHP